MPDLDPRDYAYTLATLLRVREEIAAMKRCGAVGEVLDEARQHARELEAILAGE